jgi:hypothetical protein
VLFWKAAATAVPAPAIASLAVLACLCTARPVLGQICHPAPPDDGAARGDDAADGARAAGRGLVVSLAAEAMALDGADVQGLTPSLAWQGARLGARVAVPGYRMADDRGGRTVGLGDVTVEASARVLGGGDRRAGVVAAIALPTGDADQGFGMGHAMVMPGVWAAASTGRLRIAVTGSFGASLADADAHGMHHHAGPQINPMNAREVAGSLRAGYVVTPSLELHGAALAAVPIGDGVTRAVVGVGIGWRRGSWRADAETDAGAAGRPFVSRGVLQLTRTF